jgi:hypothetical protein
MWMQQGLLGALSLLDARGYAILGAILVTLITSIVLTLVIRGRYAALAHDLSEHSRPDRPFSNRVLTRMLEDARHARHWQGRAADHQASIEQHFQAELGGLLLGERFVRAAPGLVIIFGLVGTFYGLSLSIGKLVLLVTGGSSDVNDLGASMTQGLTHALSGMSVAFSTSLFGIAAAVVLTLFGVFFNVSDRRTALMINIETHLDRVLGGEGLGAEGGAGLGASQAAELDQVVAEFARTVTGLRDSVGQFDIALQGFATTTRDFREFNLHLKDNVQRMSLSFADLSETLKTHSVALSGRSSR